MATDDGRSQPRAAALGLSKELTSRIGSAIVMIAVALFAAYYGGWPFALFWLAAGIAMLVEWTDMTGVQPRRLVQIFLGLGLAALTLLFLIGASLTTSVAVALGFLAVGSLIARDGGGRLWAASGFAYAAVIVVVPPIVRAHPNLGLLGLLWMFAVVWATDIAAYFTGRTFGGPKLCLPISPKKTWSGFLGGLLAAAICGFLVVWGAQRLGLVQPFSLRNTIILSLIASVASQIGDLGESALKRHCDVKDSSHLIPGHGGVMDRLDGFWAVSLLMGLVLLIFHFAE
ncbi:phosphatidate cytidylyltransferase [Microvirga roseola]|uniref:phosphatidate cytidylyltransferase n=1 Tax=Microvirga roseola TaxID=2883126 RepID=UPI001E645070|nr:phosphatidate cytidylyltransferase [Microvirga roseola]